MSKLLVWWKTFLARHRCIPEFCDDCGRRVRQVWRAPDDIWLKFNNDDLGGCLCTSCFDKRADRAGCLLIWVPKVDCWKGEAKS